MVRELVAQSTPVNTSVLALVELHCVFHRRMREGRLSAQGVRQLAAEFSEHLENGVWKLLPVPERLLRQTASLVVAAPADCFLRSADAIHLTTAHDLGEREIWTTDRHMLAAAPLFGLRGRQL